MNKENCALKLVDEIIHFVDCLTLNMMALRFLSVYTA